MDHATFVLRFPELKDAQPALILAELAGAAKSMNARAWANQYEDGVAQLAAHRIAVKGRATFARLIAKDGSTLYLKEFERMKASILDGFRVI